MTTSSQSEQSIAALRRRWAAHDEAWTAEDYSGVAEEFIDKHDPFLAIDVTRVAREHFPDDADIQRAQARALLDAGRIDPAKEIAERLADTAREDFRNIDLQARCYKVAARRAASPVERGQLLRAAAHLHTTLFQHARTSSQKVEACRSCAEASAMLLLQDRAEEARRLAGQVTQDVAASLDASTAPEDRCKLMCALGEAELVLGKIGAAVGRFETATGEMSGPRDRHLHRTLATTRRNVRELVRGRDTEQTILAALPPPVVMAFSGHMIDKPGRPTPRFPFTDEPKVVELIRNHLDEVSIDYGFASAACGGDLIFLEEVLNQGGEIVVVLPCAIDEFKQACLDGFDCWRPETWSERFEHVLKRAKGGAIVLSEQSASDNSVASECCNRIVAGLATQHAEFLDASVNLLALWDGHAGDAWGGTASLVAFAGEKDLPVQILSPPSAAPDTEPTVPPPAGHGSHVRLPGAEGEPDQAIVALLFADAVNYSLLKERQLSLFVEHFLKPVAEIISGFGNPVVNTWGDGLYVAIESIADAGALALRLRDFVVGERWGALGLPRDFNLRISLHAGPAYEIEDPIIGRRTFIGSNVTRAARLEPETPPGEVYVTQPFAALAALETEREFDTQYVGKVALAKDFGAYETYVLVGRES